MMSDNYDRLVELLDKGFVVACFVDYVYDTGSRKILYRDIAKVKANDRPKGSKGYGYVIEARGIIYGSWDRRGLELRGVTFRNECERLNLLYIDKV